MNVFLIIAWICAICCAAAAGFWITAAWRVHRTLRDRPTIRRGLDLPEPARRWPKVSIVVPAHNEQRVIDQCAGALRRLKYPDLEIIFVLDRCTDATRELLQPHADADARIIIIENDCCPDDWAGKCHAASVGAERATGAFLLFTDADTQFDPDLVRAAVALADDRGLGLLSLLSTLTTDLHYERIAQPVASMTLVRMFPLQRINREHRARPFANGQFLLFERREYERIGGHAAVKDALLEDIAFARRLHKMNGRGAVFLADGMLICSMYDSLEAFERGWQRIFIEACKRKPTRLRQNAWRSLTLGVVFPMLQLVSLVIGATALTTAHHAPGITLLVLVVIGLVAQVIALMRIYPLANAPRRAALLYPLGSWIVARIFFAAARNLSKRRPITWAGRQYILEPR